VFTLAFELVESSIATHSSRVLLKSLKLLILGFTVFILLPNKKVGGIRSKKGRIVDMKIKKGGRYGV